MKGITMKMEKIIILNKKRKNSEMGARETKATYKNNKISENVTWFGL